MGLKGIKAVVMTGLVLMLCARAQAQSGCSSVLIGMASCLNYVTGSSSTPSSSCCSQLASVVQSQPQCLCAALNGGGAALGVTINQTRALELPGACNVQTPPASKCNGPNGPAASPAASPMGFPEDLSGVSKTVPLTGGDSSDSSLLKMPLHLIVFFLFLVPCVLSFSRV